MDAANPLAIKESQTLFTEKVGKIFGDAELPISDFTDSAKYQSDFDKALSLLENFVVAENEFQTEAKANLYFKNIKDFLIIVTDAKKAAIDKFTNTKKKQDLALIEWEKFPIYNWFSDFPSFFCFVVFCIYWYDKWDVYYADTFVKYFLISLLAASFARAALIVLLKAILYIPYKAWERKQKSEIESRVYELPTWLKFIDAKVNGINGLIESTLNEVLSEIRRKRDVQHKDDLLGVEDKYNEKVSNRNLSERLATITAELQAAKERAKDLQDEHRLTEELRVKYAREMKEIERQSINDGNNDLMQKVDILNNLLGSK
jgi:hypothetical protein